MFFRKILGLVRRKNESTQPHSVPLERRVSRILGNIMGVYAIQILSLYFCMFGTFQGQLQSPIIEYYKQAAAE